MSTSEVQCYSSNRNHDVSFFSLFCFALHETQELQEGVRVPWHNLQAATEVGCMPAVLRRRLHNLATLGPDLVVWSELTATKLVIKSIKRKSRHLDVRDLGAKSHLLIVVLHIFVAKHLYINVFINVV